MDTLENILGEDYMELVTDVHFDKQSYKVSVRFGNQIKPIKDSTQKVTIKQGKNGLFIYEVPKSYGMEPLAVFLKKTIDMNLELQAKGKLYQQCVQQLQKVFTEHSLDELSTLKFVIGDTEDNSTVVGNGTIDFTKQLDETEVNVDSLVESEKKKMSPVKESEEPIQTHDANPEEEGFTDDAPVSQIGEHSESWKPVGSDGETIVNPTNGLVSGKVKVIM